MNEIHMRRFRNIPPLQYLLGFEAAARLGSFSRAAEELGLSQSAVSHEMRLLEVRIGQPLFTRLGRSIKLTDAGRDYQRSVMNSLEQLEKGHRRLAPFRKAGSVVIYAPHEFASRWLLPRLHLLRQAVPRCDPWIDTSGTTIDFEELEVSIGIIKASGHDPKWQSKMIMKDLLVPVASPALIMSKLKHPSELLSFQLIHDEKPHGWREWFEATNVFSEDVSAGFDFSNSDLAIGAAERGLGIALASLLLVQDSISSKQLIRPLQDMLDTKLSWFAVSNDKELRDPITQSVWNWIDAETKKTNSRELPSAIVVRSK